MRGMTIDTAREQLALIERKIKVTEAACEAVSGARLNPDMEIGGIRSRSARAKSRLFERRTRVAHEHLALIAERDRLQNIIRYHEAAPARARREVLVLAWWDSISAGDAVDIGGNAPVQVLRKSAASFTTASGSRWTVTEITGLSRERIAEIRRELATVAA